MGYEAIVYGDHGPYIEFKESHICWPMFSCTTNSMLLAISRILHREFTRHPTIALTDMQIIGRA